MIYCVLHRLAWEGSLWGVRRRAKEGLRPGIVMIVTVFEVQGGVIGRECDLGGLVGCHGEDCRGC